MFEDLSVDYLYKSQDEWKNLRSYLSDPFFEELYKNNNKALKALREQAGDSVVDVPWMLDRESVRAPIINRVIKNIAQRTAVQWFIDQSQDDLDYLWKTLDYFCEYCPCTTDGEHEATEKYAYGVTTRKIHADLETSDAAYTIAFVLDTFADEIPEALRARLLDRLINSCIKGYLDGVEQGDWWRYANYNWGAALHGCHAFAALAIWDTDRALATEVLKQAFRGLQFIFDDISRGCLCFEGQMYQTTLLNHLTDFLSVWYRLTGDHLGWIDNHFVELSIDFHMHMQGGDGDQLNFSDCTAGNKERGGAQFYWWARQYNQPQWAGYEQQITRSWADTHGAFFDVEAFWFREPQQKIAAPQLKQHFHFPGLDWMTFHTGDLWGAFRSGYNANNHDHQSLGHFILGHKKQRYLVAPGYGATKPEQHNVATAGQQEPCSEARIVRIRQWQDGLYWVCDLHGAYSKRTSLFNRHMLIIENTHVLILDHVIGNRARRPGVEWYLQTECETHFKENAMELLSTDGAAMRVDFLNEIGGLTDKAWKFGVNETGEAKQLHTLTWVLDQDPVHVVHSIMLSIEDKEYAYSREGDTVIIAMNGRRYEIDLYDLVFRLEE